MSSPCDNSRGDETPDFAASNSLEAGLRRVIDYHCQEFDMSYATLIGTLEMVKASLLDQWMHGVDDEDEDDEGDASSR